MSEIFISQFVVLGSLALGLAGCVSSAPQLRTPPRTLPESLAVARALPEALAVRTEQGGEHHRLSLVAESFEVRGISGDSVRLFRVRDLSTSHQSPYIVAVIREFAYGLDGFQTPEIISFANALNQDAESGTLDWDRVLALVRLLSASEFDCMVFPNRSPADDDCASATVARVRSSWASQLSVGAHQHDSLSVSPEIPWARVSAVGVRRFYTDEVAEVVLFSFVFGPRHELVSWRRLRAKNLAK